MTYKIGTLITLFFLTAFNMAIGREEVGKNISKTFPYNSSQTIDIANKYGDVTVKNWSKSSVKFDVSIKVKASSKKKAQAILDAIDIIFQNTGSLIAAKTEISKKSWNNISMDIDYNVYLPEDSRLNLSNKYGDCYLEDHMGAVDLDIAYGDLRTERLNKGRIDMAYGSYKIAEITNMDVELAYSDGHIDRAKNLDMRMKYSELHSEEIVNLKVASGYDEIDIDKVGKMTFDGNYGDIVLGTVDELEVDGNYGDIQIKQLNTRLFFDGSYGDISIRQINSGLKEIDVDMNYGDLEVGRLNGVNGSIYIDKSYSDVELGSGIDILDRSKRKVKAKVGNGRGANINISISYGDVEMN